ncbi:MAG: T9SS type A sorting domain-containing protein [Ignavibacteriales bacterium]|nr:MAG: T9SS type A sorting domain-containing protein [Ignavibacteriales bacterium]
MKIKFPLLFLLSVMLLQISVYAQTADGGIFGSGTTLTVRFRPSADITGGFTGGNFGIRWLSSLGAGVNLSGESSSFGYVNQGAKATSGSYDYIIYASGSLIASTTYTGGVEYTILTVTVSGGVGTGSFELCPGGFASDAGQWYIELGGADRANVNPALWYYQSTASNVTLPVELTSFTSKLLNDKIQLNWSTKTEVNNFGFDIERSGDGINFSKIGFVEGHGNSNSEKNYSFTDAPKSSSKYSYRLKQIDNDGQYEYSKIVEVEFTVKPTEYALYQNYPNPFNPSTMIKFQLPKDNFVSLKIFNAIGQEVANLVNEVKPAGTYDINFDAKDLSSGIYYYILRIGSGSQNEFTRTNKMILLK